MTRRASIIVRSMGRPELHDALTSLAAQTHRELEIVLVDATGGRHPTPPAACGPHAVRFVGGTVPRSRPAAANAGIDATTGDYIGFLDDDDLLEPAHVTRLAEALDARFSAIAAYSIAREVDASGGVIARRARDYSRLLLFQDCYIALNTVLFRRRALDTCRFDERFEICEDWDFWLQLTAIADFAFVSHETAIVRTWLGGSGTGRGPNLDLQRYRHFASRIGAKWQATYDELATAIATASAHALELFAGGQRREAEAAAEAVLASYPHEIAMLNLKGTLLALRGDIEGALARFRVASAVAPRDVASCFNVAQALEHLGCAGEAISEYDRVLALEPSHSLAAARRSTLERQSRGTSP